MANRTPIYTLLSLSWLACRPLALQTQASTPGALISIAGRPKCGTSHLNLLLSSHRDVFSLRKERCPAQGKMDNASFAQYLSFTASRAQATDGSWLEMKSEEVMQACINYFGSADGCRYFLDEAKSGGSSKTTKVLTSCLQPWHASFMLPASIPNVRVLWTQRDPADLSWSSYNFWVSQMDADDTLDKGKSGEWTGKQNYRSPNHFHELVMSGGRLSGSIRSWFHFLEIPYMRSIRETYGQDQVLFLRSEDLKLRDTVQRICDFVGLDIDGIDQKLIDSKTNAQGSLDDRGWGANSNGVDGEEGRYEISGNQPMFCETRKLIYNQARDICVDLNKEFGLRYERCLDPHPTCPSDRP